MILIEVEFHDGSKKKIQIDTSGKPFTEAEIFRTLNKEYLMNWKTYKILSEVE